MTLERSRVAQHIGIIQISHPGPTDDSQYDKYWTDGLGSQLRSMYGALLGMKPVYIGYHKLIYEDGRIPEIGFEYSPDDVRPRWPDLEYPQQVHLDMHTRLLDTQERVEISGGGHRVALAFHYPVCQPPRWPDSTRPPQLHLDVVLEESDGRDRAQRLGASHLPLRERPDNEVYADPAGHPFCLGIGLEGWPWGPGQVADYERWLAEHGTDD